MFKLLYNIENKHVYLFFKLKNNIYKIELKEKLIVF